MSSATKDLKGNWRDAANLILGLWLFLSPWVLADMLETTASWNAYVMGIIIVVAAISALVSFHEWEEWVSVLFGAWLIVSPWFLGYPLAGALVWNAIAVGILVATMAIWSLYDIHEMKAHA